MGITKRKFGVLRGTDVTEYRLENANGLLICALDYGGIVTEVRVPDRDGKFENVSLGFTTLDEYLAHSPYFGALVGRIAGRIRGGKFELDGKVYELTKNAGENQVHGGPNNFSKTIWDAEPFEVDGAVGLKLALTSPDGMNGFPGKLEVEVTYTLTNNDEWKIKYEAKSDAKTVFNPTNHIYFNLTGDASQTVLGHELRLTSDYFAAQGEDSIPTGELVDVTGTVFDFRDGRAIRDGTLSEDTQTRLVGDGYDHAFLLDHATADVDARLYDPVSGRVMTMKTDCDSVVVYTSNHFSGAFQIDGKTVPKYAGITMETQGLPNAMNEANFGSVVLEQDELFESETVFRFDVK
ncbi:galactose mutarotase [Listeria weihenstephanensis]|uniref:Aldose 1-epimerase n=1 Tax=Listeria weihenstephanensis TaxID=1006155 RepID=A0A841Z972_9LIST|nr:aldose epimerase family protein [Listeria weihenstephanensis]MBC1501017.1 galactose mutarotase [Listeria weihenstephanensis]